jgi:hypothetical protein
MSSLWRSNGCSEWLEVYTVQIGWEQSHIVLVAHLNFRQGFFYMIIFECASVAEFLSPVMRHFLLCDLLLSPLPHRAQTLLLSLWAQRTLSSTLCEVIDTVVPLSLSVCQVIDQVFSNFFHPRCHFDIWKFSGPQPCETKYVTKTQR